MRSIQPVFFMKKAIVFILICVILCQCIPNVFAASKRETRSAEGTNVCETAQQCMDNITVGWNLGCSLSTYAEESIAGWGVMLFGMTKTQEYCRSDIFHFDPATKTATVVWKPGRDNGVVPSASSARLDYIGVELWNFSLSESDVLTYSIDELRYVTKNGEVVITEGLGEKTTDMGGGTGGGTVADLKDPAIADILEDRKSTRLNSSHA